jgi:glycine C-acetyltransferase/8-amino-7-oxononanoate synthase
MTLQMESPAGAVTVIGGQRYDYFCGCGYLGLQGEPRVTAAAADALVRYGLSTATSRGGYGEHPVYTKLETQACGYFGCERVLYYASGYMGASILVQANLHAGDHFFLDDAAHFSLWDAAALSNCPQTPFHHLSPEALAKALREELQPGERPILLTDGLFPISGEIAPLPDYLALLHPLHGELIVDDAHAVGVLGAGGRGTLEHFSINDPDCQAVGTFNKAMGGFGGFLGGSRVRLNRIEQNSRILIGSSPPPLPAAAASAKALEVLRESPQLLAQLRANIEHARMGLAALGWELPDSPSPILCLDARSGINLIKLRDGLFKNGVAVEYITNYPSTPPGGALRIALFATHTPHQIDHLLHTMKELLHR